MVEAITDRVLDLAMQIQQIPSPTFSEGRRAEFVRERFRATGVKHILFDDVGNVVARIAGKGEKPPLVISAHLDTVFPEGTDLACQRSASRILGAGIGDNALGLAGLFGLVWHFATGNAGQSGFSDLPGDIYLVPNVGEEGLGDLRGMKAVMERFGQEPLAYLVLEGMTLGQIYNRGLCVRRYRIHVHTKGGHSWTDYGNPSAIHEIATLVVMLKNISIPAKPRSSLNVGVIKGGTSVNTIAAEASLELDLRSESPPVLDKLAEQVESLVAHANNEGESAIRVRAEVIGDRPAGEIAADHPLIRAAVACFAREGIEVKLNIGSTDANVPLSLGYPALCMGLTTGGGSHTSGEYIDTQPVSQGLKILFDLVQSIFRLNPR